MTIRLYVGADIASTSIHIEWLNLATQQREQMHLQQKRSDYRRLLKRLTRQHGPEQVQVVMEATGPYWLAFAEYLHQAGVAVSVLNPAQAAHFGRARLQRSKTDAADAHLLCEYGRRLQPPRWTPPPAICQQLQQRLSLRDDLVQTRSAERNRLHAFQRHPHADPDVLQRLRRHIAFLARHIQALEREIAALLDSDHAWSQHVRRLRAVQGLGLLTIAWLLTSTHAFARCPSPEAAAAFAGLAPHPRESGQWKGKRSVGGGGHAALRKTLYMAALSAARFQPRLHAFYQRLIECGKHPKVAYCAVARKLLHLAWPLVVKQRDFDPAWGSSS
jgi:transposase